jgi:hypothetical protein
MSRTPHALRGELAILLNALREAAGLTYAALAGVTRGDGPIGALAPAFRVATASSSITTVATSRVVGAIAARAPLAALSGRQSLSTGADGGGGRV